MLIVLDTNVLLIALPKTSPYRPIFDALREGTLSLAVSNEILLNLPTLKLINVYFKWQLITTDPDDNKFTDTAIAPDERDYFISFWGEIGSYATTGTDKNGEYKKGIDRTKQNAAYRGNWLVYNEGVLTEVYSGGWTPVANPGLIDKILYQKNIEYSVAGNNLNLRTGAGTKYSKNGTALPKRSILSPTGNVDNGWMEVKTDDDRSEWVNSKYINYKYQYREIRIDFIIFNIN